MLRQTAGAKASRRRLPENSIVFPVSRIGGAASTGDGGANDGKRTNKADTPTTTARSIRMRWVGWVNRYVPRTGRGSDRPFKGGCEPTEHGTKRRQRAWGSKRGQKMWKMWKQLENHDPRLMPMPDRAAHQRQTGNNKHRRKATVRQLDRTPRRSYTGTASAVSVRRLDRTPPYIPWEPRLTLRGTEGGFNVENVEIFRAFSRRFRRIPTT